MLKFRVWIGASLIKIAFRIMGLGKGAKWEAVSLIGKAPQFESLIDEVERLRKIETDKDFEIATLKAEKLRMAKELEKLGF